MPSLGWGRGPCLNIGDEIEVPPSVWAAIGTRPPEVLSLLQHLAGRRLVSLPSHREGVFLVTLQILGWQRCEELDNAAPRGKQVFVAMRFSDAWAAAYNEGIEPAVRAAGFEPMRIDRKQDNEKICDEIQVQIRRSCALVADVSEPNPGVYFEAGFALGLGLPVIWTCNAETFDTALHFDTRQYRHIKWGNPKDLLEKLEMRIRATVHREEGP